MIFERSKIVIIIIIIIIIITCFLPFMVNKDVYKEMLSGDYKMQ